MRANTPQVTNRFLLLGDEPALSGADPLQFDAVATELANLILAASDSTPFTLGIEAGWGRGKSTLMGKLCQQLDDHPGVTTVTFNAWTAEGGSVLESLIKSVLDRLDPNIVRRAARSQHLFSWARSIGTILAHWIGLHRLADTLWARVSDDPKARNDLTQLITDAMSRWRDKRPKDLGGRLMVIFIDDLDRCSPANMLQVFEAIKLYLNAPGFVFVVGFDARIVGGAIANTKSYNDPTTPERYLEKIIQVHYLIPSLSDDQADDLMVEVCGQARIAELLDPAARRLVIERNERNPRRIKRFINRFILQYQLDPARADADPELLIKLLILQEYYDFFVLFDDRAKADPITEFLDYWSARTAARQQHDFGPLEKLYAANGLAWPGEGTPDELLGRLEDELPKVFCDLARNPHFVSFIHSLAEPEREGLVHKVRRVRGPLEFTTLESVAGLGSVVCAAAPPTAPAPPGGIPGDFAGLAIMWIDDSWTKPGLQSETQGATRAVAQQLEHAGAQITYVTSGDEALEAIRSLPSVDIVLSDVTRGDDRDAGFKDAQRLRQMGYQGPLIFCSARITESRRRQAQALGAPITNRADQLLAFISRLVPARAGQR